MPNLRSDAFTIALVFAVGLALVFGAHLYDRSHELPTEPIISADVQGVGQLDITITAIVYVVTALTVLVLAGAAITGRRT